MKLVARFSRAKVVVILGDRPLEVLRGATFRSHLIIVSGASNNLSSDKIKVYAVPKGTDTLRIGASDRVAQVSMASALTSNLESGQIYVIDSPLSMDHAIASLVTALLEK